MSLIWRYCRPHLWLACLAPLCVAIEVWAELEQPRLMSVIVDEGILGGDATLIVPTGVRMLLYVLLGVGGGILSIYAAGRLAYRFGADLRRDLYRRATHFAFADVDRLEAPSIITRLTDDVSRIQQLVQASMRLLFRAPFLFVGAVAMALMINVDISLLLVGLMLVSFVFVLWFMRRTLPMFLAQQARRDSFTAALQETLVAIRVVKAYTNEDLERARFARANDALTDSTVGVGRYMASMMPVVSFTLNAGVIAVVWMGAGQVSQGHMLVGGIMATINYLAQIQMSLMMASRVIMSITQAEASVTRLEELLTTPTEEERDASSGRVPSREWPGGDLSLREVAFRYTRQGARQLHGVTLTVAAGSTVAIMGETGSGKTTLVQLLARFYDPLEGSVSVGGVDLRDLDRATLREHVALVPQHALLFAGSVADNLREGRPDASDEELWQALETADMAEHLRSLPDGLRHRVEQGGANLSGGQRQRLCLARALLRKPDVLILDDSFSALDMATESRIRLALNRLHCTLVIVAQRIATIRGADQIIVLDRGSVEAAGDHDALMRRSQTYRETFLAQQAQ